MLMATPWALSTVVNAWDVVAVGDGALGFWSAVRDVWPQTAEQRDWFHKLGNVLDKLPKPLQPKAKRALHDILAAETRLLTGVARYPDVGEPKAPANHAGVQVSVAADPPRPGRTPRGQGSPGLAPAGLGVGGLDAPAGSQRSGERRVDSHR